MMNLVGSINPDQRIRVAVVFPDGRVKVYEPLRKTSTTRNFAYSTAFPTYGKAKLWADEFEATNRRMKLKEEPE